MTEREDAIEKYLIGRIEALGGLCEKWVCPGKRGVPDRLCFLPGGVFFIVETKRPKGGVVAELQKVRRKELQDRGARVYIAKTRGEVDGIIRVEAGA